MIPMMSLIASATATGAMLTMCSSKDRQASRKAAANKNSGKSSKSKRASSKSSRASSTASGTKSHRSSKSGKSHRKSKKGGKKSSKSKKDASKKSGAPTTVAALPPGATSKRQSETKKSSRSDRSSKKSKRSGKKCKAQQCEPNKLKKEQERNAICPSNSSDASSKSGKSGKSSRRQKKSTSGSGSLSGEKALKAVPNNLNYKFPEGQIKPSSFRASPAKLPFAPTGGVQTVTIPNNTKSRKAFKVKTSDNILYRVNPVHGFVEPGQNMSIDVLRHNGTEKTDHLVVLTSEAAKDATCAKAIFETDPPRELTVVPLVAH